MRVITWKQGETTRVCDGKCYNALGPDCDCICEGRNHGVGLVQALENTRKFEEEYELECESLAVDYYDYEEQDDEE